MSDNNHSSNHILESVLISYFQMGLKIVPICEDGKTPNVIGLLSSDEDLISIQESKTGKVEPVNYINNHPEFWTEERLRKEAHRFKNVATLPGKTRLKTKDGNPLYLNILDIDSELVYTILCRLIGSDRKDLYFIDRLCKSTFVSKTKKNYGRHIFWLSDKQHKQIITSECKPGYEFEIKTTFSQVALPESRHRDDPNFYYQKIGIDKIERFDGMYERLIDTLGDCLKPKDDKHTNYSRENTNNSKITLNEEQINSLHQLLSPCYRAGYRHQITYGLSGLMHKHHVTIESSVSLIQKLSANDEERDSRLLVLNSTYEKNPQEVSGYQYLISVLENVADGGRAYAKSILSKIITVIFAQINNQGIIIDLTERIMTEFTFKTMRDNEEIYYYDATTGLYRKFGDRMIKEYVEILHPSIKTFQVNEIIQKIKRRTPVDRDQFDNNTDIINVQNGLLNIWTAELKEHSPEFLSIIQLPLVYNSKSRCPNIGRFLDQVLHHEDVLTALEVIGYTLYRTTIYEKAVMLHGNGDNGKGVFIKLIEAFVGRENCSHVPLQELDNTDKFSSADLFGKLVNTFADLKSQKLLATGYFKTLVSGDSVRAQEKYGKPFNYRNFAKLIFSTNKIPDSDDKTYAYYKRWLILSFEKVFQGIIRDTNLINKLTTRDELSGLLNLTLISLRRLKKDNGFKEISVEKVRKEYEHNANTVKAFIDEKCTVDLTSSDYSIPTVYLYNEYENFCQEKRARPLDMNVFGSKLKEYGIERDRIRSHGDREYHYFGIQLRSNLRGQNQSLFS